MRRVKIFSGTSHPLLTESICERLGTNPSKAELKKFSNGETSVNIGCSVREQDVFIVQSGSETVNDSIMELLIMISACKGGSANKITAVMPYFPYSKQSKKKSHRGAITARMIANLLTIAGVNHVITVDLHASQMQGFFSKPVDNLYAEPLIARWVKNNVQNWKEAVVVSKNPGGTKRVTSLADALKLNFALITTDRRRANYDALSSKFHSRRHSPAESVHGDEDPNPDTFVNRQDGDIPTFVDGQSIDATGVASLAYTGSSIGPPSIELSPEPPIAIGDLSISAEVPPPASTTSTEYNYHLPPHPEDDFDDEYTDDNAREVTYGRLVQGHIVDDDYPSVPASVKDEEEEAPCHMVNSINSITSSNDHALGGTVDVNETDDEEEPGVASLTQEKMITLVGHVRDRTVLLVDDMIDRPGSWIAAAEHCVKRAGANRVYCIATHGVFGGDCLEEMEACSYIDYIIVTNSFPIPVNKINCSRKLRILDISALLSEAIRRNHHGESISALFQHFD
ncbi:phosphoribosyl pyrophosphokinase [Terfezia boudieri ATCC MYA-4762]|uniref:Ribose-phosphate pyrophosphokinase 1 n=1 Tax=Terfezia boudieri ATCC MYA-4762 TaxID=1051890 RepID=A0A3N4LS44_9PEZI|nr:phosphoribosyl pyrophosphokinase [Terfezia boudieri ATCC MYA-4762]